MGAKLRDLGVGGNGRFLGVKEGEGDWSRSEKNCMGFKSAFFCRTS